VLIDKPMQTMADSLSKDDLLTEAFAIVENTQDMDGVVSKLRDLLKVDHVVYYSSKLEAPTVPYIRLTYPGSWVKRYLQMGYGEVDLVLREGFKRTLPFEWKEMQFVSPAEAAFQSDALAHGIGPHGYTIPVASRHLPGPLCRLLLAIRGGLGEISVEHEIGIDRDRQPAS